jgi:hypothetical protein
MRIADHLSKEQKQQLNQIAKVIPKKNKPKPKKVEKVNWPEIMGMNRDTYKRVNGAMRRR